MSDHDAKTSPLDAKMDQCLDMLDATIATTRETRRLTMGSGELWFWLFVVPAAAVCGALMAWSAS